MTSRVKIPADPKTVGGAYYKVRKQITDKEKALARFMKIRKTKSNNARMVKDMEARAKVHKKELQEAKEKLKKITTGFSVIREQTAKTRKKK